MQLEKEINILERRLEKSDNIIKELKEKQEGQNDDYDQTLE